MSVKPISHQLPMTLTTGFSRVLNGAVANFPILAFIVCFVAKSLLNEQSVSIEIDGKRFEYPELRLFFVSLCSFIGSTVCKLVYEDKEQPVLHPLYKNKQFICSAVSYIVRNSPDYLIIS